MPWANYDWLLHTTLGGSWLQYAVFCCFFFLCFLTQADLNFYVWKIIQKNRTRKLVASYNAYFCPGTSTGSGSNGILSLLMSLLSNGHIETGRNRKERHRNPSIHNITQTGIGDQTFRFEHLEALSIQMQQYWKGYENWTARDPVHDLKEFLLWTLLLLINYINTKYFYV